MFSETSSEISLNPFYSFTRAFVFECKILRRWVLKNYTRGHQAATQLTAPILYQWFTRMVYHMWIRINNWYPRIIFWILVEQESLSGIKTGILLKISIKINLHLRFVTLNQWIWIEKWNLWCYYVNTSKTKWQYIAALENCVSVCKFTDSCAILCNSLSIPVFT